MSALASGRHHAGTLDERVSVIRVTETPDGRGGFTTGEATVATVWAQVEPLRGQERVIADQQRGVTGYLITARNEGEWASITVSDHLEWRGVRLNVRHAPVAGRGLFRSVEAEAGVVTS